MNLMVIILSVLFFFSYANEKNEFDYFFTHKDNYYSFRARFVVQVKFDCLFNVIYEIDHLTHYSSGAQSLELIRQGKEWYDVTYTYRKFIVFENRSTWRRTRQREKGRVIFEMMSSSNNSRILPQVLSSTGYYQITPEKEGLSIEYFQECHLEHNLFKNSYIKQAKKEAIQFLYEFKDYINKTCTADTSRSGGSFD